MANRSNDNNRRYYCSNLYFGHFLPIKTKGKHAVSPYGYVLASSESINLQLVATTSIRVMVDFNNGHLIKFLERVADAGADDVRSFEGVSYVFKAIKND